MCKNNLIHLSNRVDQGLTCSDEDSKDELIEKLTNQIKDCQQLVELIRLDRKSYHNKHSENSFCRLEMTKCDTEKKSNSPNTVDDSNDVCAAPDYQVFEVTVKKEDTKCDTDATVDEFFESKRGALPQTLFSELKHAIEPKAKEHRERQQLAAGHPIETESESEEDEQDSKSDDFASRRMQMNLVSPQVSFAQLIADRSKKLDLMNDAEEFSG